MPANEVNYMQATGKVSCLRCPWSVINPQNWSQLLNDHLNEVHPNWQSDGLHGGLRGHYDSKPRKANEVTADVVLPERPWKVGIYNGMMPFAPTLDAFADEMERLLREVEAQRDELQTVVEVWRNRVAEIANDVQLAEQEKAKLVEALTAIIEHHKRINRKAGRDIQESTTIAIAREALTSTQPPQGEQKPKGGA